MSILYGVKSSTTTGLVTAAGTTYRKEIWSFGGDLATVYISDEVAEWTHVTLALMCHGYTESHTFLEGHPLWASPRDKIIDRGWIIVAGNLGGFKWGNEQAMNYLVSYRAWASEHWLVDRTLLVGGSMGGLTVLNALGRNIISDVVATVAMVAVVDTQAMASDYQSSIQGSYGATSVSDLTVKQAGYDPARDNPQKWANKRLYLNQGSTDTIVVPSLHGDVFMARAATPASITYVVGNHAHAKVLDDAMLAWLDQVAPAYIPNQVEPAEPVPEEGVPHTGPPPTSSGSGVFTTTGTAVSLYSTSGMQLSLSRTPG